MNKYLKIFVLINIIIAILLIAISEKYLNCNRLLGLKNNDVTSLNQRLIDLQLKCSQFNYLENLIINQEINPKLLLEDVEANQFEFQNLSIKSPYLVFLIHQTDCSSCWGKALDIITKEFNFLYDKSIIFITSYGNFRDIYVPLKEINPNPIVYNIVQGDLTSNISNYDMPVILSIGSEKQIESLLVVDLDLADCVRSYLKAFVERTQITTK